MWWPPQWLSSCCLSRAPWISADMSEGRRSNSNSLLRGWLPLEAAGAAVTRDSGVMNTHAPNEGFVWRAAVAALRRMTPWPQPSAVCPAEWPVAASLLRSRLQTSSVCRYLGRLSAAFPPRCPRAKRVRSGVAPLRATFTQRVRCFYSNAFVRSKSHVK